MFFSVKGLFVFKCTNNISPHNPCIIFHGTFKKSFKTAGHHIIITIKKIYILTLCKLKTTISCITYTFIFKPLNISNRHTITFILVDNRYYSFFRGISHTQNFIRILFKLLFPDALKAIIKLIQSPVKRNNNTNLFHPGKHPPIEIKLQYF